MALSDDEKVQIRYVLGYSIFEDGGPSQRAIDSLSAYPAAEPIVRELLLDIASCDARLKQSRVTALATQDGAIQTRAAYSLAVLRSHGRQAVGRLSSFLSIVIKRDIFAAGAPGEIGSGDPSGPFMDAGLPGSCGS